MSKGSGGNPAEPYWLPMLHRQDAYNRIEECRNMNLKLFCNPGSRHNYTREPWSYLTFTYAVDGVIAVRVTRDPVQLELPNTAKTAEQIDEWLKAMPVELPPMPTVQLPSLKPMDCEKCERRGTEHDCPNCECTCRDCGGNGYIDPQVVVRYGGTLINAKHWARIATLSKVRLASKPNANRHVLFIFDGGSGIVMPMRDTEENATIVDAANQE